MKKSLFVFVLLSFCLCSPVFAHPGKTDGAGGHHDRSSGEYHYHHGYSAHQHTNGICPFDFVDNTDHNSSHFSDSENDENTELGASVDKIEKVNSYFAKEKDPTKEIKNTILCILLTPVAIIPWYIPLFVSKYRKKKNKSKQ